MQKRTLLLIIFSVLFGIGTLFATGTAAAQDACDAPLSCTTHNGWTVELMGGTPVPVEGGYEWRYLITKQDLQELQSVQSKKSKDDDDCDDDCDDCKCQSPGGLKNFNLSIPVCCPNPVIIDEESNPKLRIMDPGIPGNADFQKGNLQSFVIKQKFKKFPNEAEVWFIANTDNISKGTVGLVNKGAKNLKICEIAVPGCSETEYALPVVSTKSLVATTDGREFKQLLDPATQCPTEIWELIPCLDGEACRPNGDCAPCEGEVYEWLLEKRPADEVLKAEHGDGTPAEKITFVGQPDQGCAGAIVKSDSDNSWFFCFLGWCYF